MIYAKTKLKKLPKTCKECIFSKAYTPIYYHADRYCMLSAKKPCPTEKSPHGNERYTKPKWCPLMEVEE